VSTARYRKGGGGGRERGGRKEQREVEMGVERRWETEKKKEMRGR
jgi:hypothetical protein